MDYLTYYVFQAFTFSDFKVILLILLALSVIGTLVLLLAAKIGKVQLSFRNSAVISFIVGAGALVVWAGTTIYNLNFGYNSDYEVLVYVIASLALGTYLLMARVGRSFVKSIVFAAIVESITYVSGVVLLFTFSPFS